MPIEIKELRIKVNVVETDELPFHLNQNKNAINLQEMKATIVNECITKVLEKIKEKAER